MKTLKLKSILFGLMTVLAVAVVMTSCEQELINDSIIEDKDNYLNVENLQNPEHEAHSQCGGECDREVDYTKEITVKLPFAKKAMKVTVDVADGIAYYEGDIILGEIDELLKKGVAKDSQHWPNSIIPYQINSQFSNTQKGKINSAIDRINAKTNLCVVPRTNESNYVRFTPVSSGCGSSVGMVGGMQEIRLSPNCSEGSTMHEILHAAGIYHEQAREDRNNYVIVNEDNIEVGKEHNFYQKINGASDYGPYDYGSIMHYSMYAFAAKDANGNLVGPTIIPLAPNVTIGQRNELSTGDIATINTLYSGCNTNSCNSAPDVSDLGEFLCCGFAYSLCQGYDGDQKEFQLVNISTGDVQYDYGTSYYALFLSLASGTDYKFRVRRKCGTSGSYGPWSDYKYFTSLSCLVSESDGDDFRLKEVLELSKEF